MHYEITDEMYAAREQVLAEVAEMFRDAVEGEGYVSVSYLDADGRELTTDYSPSLADVARALHTDRDAASEPYWAVDELELRWALAELPNLWADAVDESYDTRRLVLAWQSYRYNHADAAGSTVSEALARAIAECVREDWTGELDTIRHLVMDNTYRYAHS